VWGKRREGRVAQDSLSAHVPVSVPASAPRGRPNQKVPREGSAVQWLTLLINEVKTEKYIKNISNTQKILYKSLK